MTAVDTESFRLRRFVDRLVQTGDCEVHDSPIDLVDVAGRLDGNPKAVLFRSAGPEKAELVGNVMGSRKRLAPALGTDEKGLLGELNKRLTKPISAGGGRRRSCAGAAGGPARERSRPLRAAGASAARRGWRALYLGQPRLRAVSPTATPMSAAAGSCCAARATPAST